MKRVLLQPLSVSALGITPILSMNKFKFMYYGLCDDYLCCYDSDNECVPFIDYVSGKCITMMSRILSIICWGGVGVDMIPLIIQLS